MPGPLDWKQGDMLLQSHDSFIMKWNVLLCLFFGNMHLQNISKSQNICFKHLQTLFSQTLFQNYFRNRFASSIVPSKWGWMFQILCGFQTCKPGPLNRTCFHCLWPFFTKAVASWRCVEIVEIVHQQCKSCMKGWYKITFKICNKTANEALPI